MKLAAFPKDAGILNEDDGDVIRTQSVAYFFEPRSSGMDPFLPLNNFRFGTAKRGLIRSLFAGNISGRGGMM
jgi:hypothetical protein